MKSAVCATLALFFALCPVAASLGAEDLTPWSKADHALNATLADLKSGGIRALRPHLDDLEEALANADKSFAVPEKGDVIVLADGPADVLMAMAGASQAYPGRKVVAVADPYPAIAFYLGSYYNEIHRPDQALRVLDRQRALEPNSLSVMRPHLVSERAIALSGLKRLPEALAVYEEGLKLGGLSDKDKARMLRGRGFILTDMERLDEAEAAYNESLKVEPDNQIAKQELDYIRRLRLGGNKAASGIVAPDGKPIKN